MRALRVLAALVCALAFHASVHAASFDCDKASAPREKLICATPTLSEMDTKLAQMYQERRELLSPQGADLLRRTEQGWLHFLAAVCPPSKIQASCLQREYKERLDQLSHVGERKGPFVFNRVDLFATKPYDQDEDERDESPPVSVKHVAYPLIDNASTPETLAWNKLVEKKIGPGIGDDCGAGRDEVDYRIGYANEKMISTSWTNSAYCYGTPHGFWSSSTKNIVLDGSPHDLDPTELFELGWRPELRALYGEALNAAGWTPPNVDGQTSALSEVIDPKRWFFSDQGLEIVFSAYEGGCYVCNAPPAPITWAKLKPLLVKNSPVP